MNKLINIKYDLKALMTIYKMKGYYDEEINKTLRVSVLYGNWDESTSSRLIYSYQLSILAGPTIYTIECKNDNKVRLYNPNRHLYRANFDDSYKTIYKYLTGLDYRYLPNGECEILLNNTWTKIITPNGNTYSTELDLFDTKSICLKPERFKKVGY